MSRLNCKQGDLAVYVGQDLPLKGRLVTCVELLEKVPAWITDPPLPMRHGGLSFAIWDEALRPIRDQPGEDEMLRIAGKPQDQREPA